MKIKVYLIALILLILTLLPVQLKCLAYCYESTGNSARIFGLGYTFVGIADDPTAIYWNPAGIARAGGVTFTSTNPYNIPGYNVTNFGISYPINRTLFGFTTGVGFHYSSDMGTVSDGTFTVKTGEARFGVGVGFGKGRLSLGGTCWFSQLVNGEEKSSDKSVDFGLLWQLNNFKAGMSLRNLNAIAPVETAVGVSYLFPIGDKAVFLEDIIIALDLTSNSYDGQSDFNINAGIEISSNSGIAFRFGSNGISPVSSVGVGFSKGRLQFDYSFGLHELGDTHYLSVGYEL